jgi:hypothetical protein
MRTITWLHLSDLHFRASDAYNINVVLEAFVQDVPRLLAENGLHPDFLAVTGDIAFSGQAEEYDLAWHFLDGLREKLNELPKERLFIVPGNHDVNRKAITPMSSAAMVGLDDPDRVNELLGDKEDLRVLLKKFDNYAAFLKDHFEGHLCLNEKEYYFARALRLADRQIVIMGLNSAWASTSDEDEKVKLLIGERQVREVVKQADEADICLALMHHPFESLKDFDREVTEAVLAQSCHFILRGHRHDMKLVRQLEPDAEIMVLSAGACYQKRRDFNSCNCVCLDISEGKGTVYLYAYSDKRGGHWVRDTFTYPNLRDGEWSFELPAQLTSRRAPTRRGQARPRPTLDCRLSETMRLYLSTSFDRDQYAQLDQAGEMDPERTTLLRRVFVDLEVQPRRGAQPCELIPRQPSLFETARLEEAREAILEDGTFSAMDFFLKERWPSVVLIGGPGMGKSTLGQYLAQVHRATLLGRTGEFYEDLSNNAEQEAPKFEPQTQRFPFRVVLKYFAQWLSEGPSLDSLEAYLANQVHKCTSRETLPEDIHCVLRTCPCLIVFDGLDEVMEPTLRNRMLARLGEFLGRAHQLGANLQIVATSRPTGYKDQFDPERFLHLNLLPLSSERVSLYAHRWIRAKVSLEEERERILETLAECQENEQVKLLMGTPLQVTIVLLIIKGGGHPPRQREALFNEYWGTIFRRENAKAKWIILSEEASLFDLHAYLAYLLHRRAASEGTSSLLPEAEFHEAVRGFLRQKDTVSPDEFIDRRAAQLVSEARERLVLLVEPQSGLFGFELRPLQEFFAAAYLAQTASDTAQRFERFKAIARSDHWHNVGLFFAGRVVRNFTGEAANVLELVCRPVDRELPDHYLRRGAWLALDIAADGAFAANRDLQYGALEYGLSVLGSGLSNQQREHLRTALRQLPPEDQRDILQPVAKDRLRALPLSCLETALEVCGEFLKQALDIQKDLHTCLITGKLIDQLAALDLAVQHQADPDWLASQLQRYWSVWGSAGRGVRLCRWWNQAPEYIRSVLLAWSPSDKQIRQLLDAILDEAGYWPGHILLPRALLGILSSPLDQAIAALECLSICRHTRGIPPLGESIAMSSIGSIRFVRPGFVRNRTRAILDESAPTADYLGHIQALLERPDLLPHLRVFLWLLHWDLNIPTLQTAAAFFEDMENIAKTIPVGPFFRRLSPQWPLLALALNRLESGDWQGVERLLPLLDGATQIDIGEQVRAAIGGFVRQASEQQQVKLWGSLALGAKVNIPQLAPLAKAGGVTIEELVRLYTSLSIRGGTKLNSAFLQRAFSQIEDYLSEPEKLSQISWWILTGGLTWEVDPELLTHGQHLLSKLLEQWSDHPAYVRRGIVDLFLTLLAYDPSTLEQAPRLLAALADAQAMAEGPLWAIMERPGHVAQVDHLAGLTGFVSHPDKVLREGACVLWETIVDSLPFRRRMLMKTESLHLDWRDGWNLVCAQGRVRRRRGIALLTLSHFPVEDETRRTQLLNTMEVCEEPDESQAWARLIGSIAMSDAQVAQWQQLLEAILSEPRRYTASILAAAMERYAALAGQIGPEIPADEASLGLPSGS